MEKGCGMLADRLRKTVQPHERLPVHFLFAFFLLFFFLGTSYDREKRPLSSATFGNTARKLKSRLPTLNQESDGYSMFREFNTDFMIDRHQE